jgi:hypothetical protein
MTPQEQTMQQLFRKCYQLRHADRDQRDAHLHAIEGIRNGSLSIESVRAEFGLDVITDTQNQANDSKKEITKENDNG